MFDRISEDAKRAMLASWQAALMMDVESVIVKVEKRAPQGASPVTEEALPFTPPACQEQR